jgi:hypothetical protein
MSRHCRVAFSMNASSHRAINSAMLVLVIVIDA